MKKNIILVILVILIQMINKQVEAYGFGFQKNHNHQQPQIGEYAKILADNDAYYVGDSKTKKIYLTFDCGYENGYTSDILQVLKEKEVEATFFITGHYLDSATDIVNKMIEDGHIIGNHSDKHKDITTLTPEAIQKEINDLKIRFQAKTNCEMSTFYRPPAGSFDEKSLKVIKDMGYKTIFWSLAYVDWNNNKIDVRKEIGEHIHNGAILLMHAVSKENADALGLVIDDLKSAGYEFSSLYDLTKKRLC